LILTAASLIGLIFGIWVNAMTEPGDKLWSVWQFFHGSWSIHWPGAILVVMILMLDTLESIIVNIPLSIVNAGGDLLNGLQSKVFETLKTMGVIKEDEEGKWEQVTTIFKDTRYSYLPGAGSVYEKQAKKRQRRVVHFQVWRFTPAVAVSAAAFLAGMAFRIGSEPITWAIGSALLVIVLTVAVHKVTRPVDFIGRPIKETKENMHPMGKQARDLVKYAFVLPTVIALLLTVFLPARVNRVLNTASGAVDVSLDAADRGVDGADKAVNPEKRTPKQKKEKKAKEDKAGAAATLDIELKNPLPEGILAFMIFLAGLAVFMVAKGRASSFGIVIMAAALLPAWFALSNWVHDYRAEQDAIEQVEKAEQAKAAQARAEEQKKKEEKEASTAVAAKPKQSTSGYQKSEPRRLELCAQYPDHAACTDIR